MIPGMPLWTGVVRDLRCSLCVSILEVFEVCIAVAVLLSKACQCSLKDLTVSVNVGDLLTFAGFSVIHYHALYSSLCSAIMVPNSDIPWSPTEREKQPKVATALGNLAIVARGGFNHANDGSSDPRIWIAIIECEYH